MKLKDISEPNGLRCAGGQSGRNSGYCCCSRTILRKAPNLCGSLFRSLMDNGTMKAARAPRSVVSWVNVEVKETTVIAKV
jgi:hypothetical protein